MSIKRYVSLVGLSSMAALFSMSVGAYTFQTDSVEGNFDSTIQGGFGVRLQNPSCSRIGDPSVCATADTGGWSNTDNGNLNYNKGGLFTEYLKGNHELLLKFGDGWKFLGRATWLMDVGANNTDHTELSSAGKDAIVRDRRILDFWVSKDFQLANNQGRVRFGNQVINWGESLFLGGGINASNAIDFQRIAQPGTQIKEVQLPAPMLSASSTIGQNLNVEAYYQFGWNKSRFAPVGGYWSMVDLYNKGSESLYLDTNNFNIGGLDPAAAAKLGVSPGFELTRADDINAKNSGQFGLSARYQPTGSNLNLGVYALNYHDKTPNLSFTADATGTPHYQWSFLENRQLYGVSANFPVGNWAVGWELAYRPKDAVALSGCYGQGGALDSNTNAALTADCKAYVDQKRYDMHLTGILSLTPSDHGTFLKLLGNPSTATLFLEAAATRFPDLKDEYNRTNSDGAAVLQAPASGYWTWTKNDPSLGRIASAAGTKDSSAINFDFSWTYDGSLISGWQVTPEIYYFHALSGRTPTFGANYMEGAKSSNLIITFTQNPAKWVAALNYAAWWGGKESFDQPYADRDFVGGYLSRNF